MEKEIRKLWISALKNESKAAYRKLGKHFLKGDETDQEMGKLCLQKAMDLGDDESFFLYHKRFSKGKKVIEDREYEEFAEEWKTTESEQEKKLIWRYLQLGTEKQKKMWGVS